MPLQDSLPNRQTRLGNADIIDNLRRTMGRSSSAMVRRRVRMSALAGIYSEGLPLRRGSRGVKARVPAGNGRGATAPL
jgi:hypothetical protein